MPECDPRLTRRLAMMLEDWSPQRQASIPECSRSAAVAKASYRLLSNPRVAAVAVQRSHREATWQRMAGHAVVLAVADTTSFNLTGREQAEGLDPIGFGRGSMQGFLLHVVAALSEQGAMLGVLHTHLWAREKDGKTERQKRAVRKAAPSSSNRADDTHCAVHPRRLHHSGQIVWEALEAQRELGRMELRVPAAGKRPARRATLALRAAAARMVCAQMGHRGPFPHVEERLSIRAASFGHLGALAASPESGSPCRVESVVAAGRSQGTTRSQRRAVARS